MATLKEIFKEANYVVDFDNRSNAVKSINFVLSNTSIEIHIVKKGFVKTSSNGFKYNISIKLPNVTNRGYNIKAEPYEVLKCIGEFLKLDEVRTHLVTNVSLPTTCSKCDGYGYLSCFSHYANGVCFDCFGLGCVGSVSVSAISREKYESAGIGYINKFSVTKDFSLNFPTCVQIIKEVAFLGHETAVTYLGENSEYYFIYQPICRANNWYQIPKCEIDKFKKEFLKIKKIAL